jgi:hypothetical protein
MSVCSDAAVTSCCDMISPEAHLLLREVSRNPKRNRGIPQVRGETEDWAAALGMPTESVKHLREELKDTGFLRQVEGRYLLMVACDCGQTSPKKSPSDAVQLVAQGQQTTAGVLASRTRSASIVPSRSARQDDIAKREALTPDEALGIYLNGAAEDEVREARSKRKDSAYELTEFFIWNVQRVARKNGTRLLPDAIQRKALSGTFARWRREGITGKEIRGMVMLFCNRYPAFHKEGADPGKVFLANRRKLLAEYREQSYIIQRRDTSAPSGRRYNTAADLLKKGK